MIFRRNNILDRPAGPQYRSFAPKFGDQRTVCGRPHLGPAGAAKPLVFFLEVMRPFGLNVGPSA